MEFNFYEFSKNTFGIFIKNNGILNAKKRHLKCQKEASKTPIIWHLKCQNWRLKFNEMDPQEWQN